MGCGSSKTAGVQEPPLPLASQDTRDAIASNVGEIGDKTADLKTTKPSTAGAVTAAPTAAPTVDRSALSSDLEVASVTGGSESSQVKLTGTAEITPPRPSAPSCEPGREAAAAVATAGESEGQLATTLPSLHLSRVEFMGYSPEVEDIVDGDRRNSIEELPGEEGSGSAEIEVPLLDDGPPATAADEPGAGASGVVGPPALVAESAAVTPAAVVPAAIEPLLSTAAASAGEPEPLGPEEVAAYHRELLSFIKTQAGVSASFAKPQIQYEADGLTPVDPSKMGGWVDPLKDEDAFGGTREMAEVEKDFAQALRGGLDGGGVQLSGATAAVVEAPPRPAGYLRSQGEWIRTMNQQRTCYLYVHTYTQAQRSTRPEGAGPYPEDAIEAAAAAAAEAEREAAKARAAKAEAAFPSTTVAGLRAAVAELAQAGKTPLLLATGPAYDAALAKLLCWDGRGLDLAAWRANHAQLQAQHAAEAEAYLAEQTAEQSRKVSAWTEEAEARKAERREADGDDYADSDEECPEFGFEPYKPEWDGTYHLDTAPFVLPFRRTKVKFDEHVEACRQKLRRCMAAGGTAVVDLKGLAPSFSDKIGHKKYKGAFPLTLFDPVKHAASAKNGIFVRAKGDPAPTVAPTFQVVVLAQQEPKRYTKELSGCFEGVWDKLEARRVLLPENST